MFNIGFSELILILLVAFVIVGPKDLPKVARALGRGVRNVKRWIDEFKEETGLDEAIDEFNKTSRDLERTLKAVSYTHLDVYKRQVMACPIAPKRASPPSSSAP